MKDYIHEESMIHIFIGKYIENYVHDILSWYKIDNIKISKLINSKDIFNEISNIKFNLDVVIQMLDSIDEKEREKYDVSYDISYDKKTLEEIFKYYNMKKLDDSYILDISEFLNCFPNLKIVDAVSFYISTNILNPKLKKNTNKKYVKK